MPLKVLGGSFAVAIDVTYNSGGGSVIYDPVNTGLSTTDRIGWVLEKMEDFTVASTAQFDTTADNGYYGLCLSNQINLTGGLSTVLSVPQVKWTGYIQRFDFGTAATGAFYQRPVLFDYTSMPDGGILMVPQPLYAFVFASGITGGTFTFKARAWFHAVQLTDADYFNLLQSNQLLTA